MKMNIRKLIATLTLVGALSGCGDEGCSTYDMRSDHYNTCESRRRTTIDTLKDVHGKDFSSRLPKCTGDSKQLKKTEDELLKIGVNNAWAFCNKAYFKTKDYADNNSDFRLDMMLAGSRFCYYPVGDFMRNIYQGKVLQQFLGSKGIKLEPKVYLNKKEFEADYGKSDWW